MENPIQDEEILEPTLKSAVKDARVENSEVKTVDDISLPESPDVFVDDDDEYNTSVIDDHDASVDIFYLNRKDTDYHYRFLYDTQQNLSIKTSNLLYRGGGWQLCGRKHLVNRIGVSEKFVSPDGHYRVGDQVLAYMPEDLYQKKVARKQKENQLNTENLNRKLQEGDPYNPDVAGSGHENMLGLQTQKQLGLR